MIDQRRDKYGVRLVRTGSGDNVVLADITYAILNHKLTFDELHAIVTEHAEMRAKQEQARRLQETYHGDQETPSGA